MTTRSRPTRDAQSHASADRGSVRIIGGQWKRRTLDVVAIDGLRPTPSRVRETLFNWLAHAYGGSLDGLSALDLFAGSGALGLEAASRGAAPVVLVERDPHAVRQLRQAEADLPSAGRFEVRVGDAFEVGRQMRRDGRQFDIVFLDPPFGHQRLDDTLPLTADLCRAGGFVYVEADAALTDQLVEPTALEPYRADRAGGVFYHLLRCNKKND